MSLIWYLVIGGIIGWLTGVILGKDVPIGIIGNMVAGIVGSSIGSAILKIGLGRFQTFTFFQPFSANCPLFLL